MPLAAAGGGRGVSGSTQHAARASNAIQIGYAMRTHRALSRKQDVVQHHASHGVTMRVRVASEICAAKGV